MREGGVSARVQKGAGLTWVCLSADARRLSHARALHLQRGRQRQRIAFVRSLRQISIRTNGQTDGPAVRQWVYVCVCVCVCVRWRHSSRWMLLLSWRDADSVMHHFAWAETRIM